MRHGNHRYTIGSSPSHRKSLMRNLAVEVIDHGKIKTTHVKAKSVQPWLEKLVTIAKTDSVANRRLAYSKLNNRDAVNKLFTEVAPKFKTRNGGYTRVLKSSDSRVGDGAPVSYIMFVE